ncbi:PQQ-dependent sugar dehydrogenase [Herpetosiphon giganteus]|uniref:PQQ-dependent sugar dehydrogenase n=1 Tax=Herpetosiphon giganteus TaxID=2029754 RepID=UPI001958F1C2|nr:PQQ-dependent sugar dehydrogenase [Herpetosiphon giganteus]MBM7845153.1 glucose/arabinose dehydrogenase [Herpetosiphon giganteus]
MAHRRVGRLLGIASIALLLSMQGHVFAENAPPPPNGEIVEPTKLPVDPALVQQLRLPAGFWIDVWAKDVGNARMLVMAPNGILYVTRREQGDILALEDSDQNGQADLIWMVASNLPLAHGLTIHEGWLYLATDKTVQRATLRDDGSLGEWNVLIDDLPDAGQHPNRTLAVGPDGKLYITVGSTCNACAEPNPESATILVAELDGSNRQIYASGLRNTIGFDWHPGSQHLWSFDHGSDWRGNDQPPEELNLLQQGGNYGWPWCFANQQIDPYIPNAPKDQSKAEFCAKTQAPILTYTAHSAPIGMAFYDQTQFPAEYHGDAFVAMRGSWNRNPPTGYKVVRVRFQNGWPVAVDDFLTGFLLEQNGQYAQFGRVAGITLAPYGSLFVSDDMNGVIYRISWAGTP